MFKTLLLKEFNLSFQHFSLGLPLIKTGIHSWQCILKRILQIIAKRVFFALTSTETLFNNISSLILSLCLISGYEHEKLYQHLRVMFFKG